MTESIVKFGEIIRSVSTRRHQIDSLKYAATGRFPVVDQSAKPIAGYSDDEGKLVRAGPLVVFGDHTRTVKLVDFPFVVGADGTKLLQPVDKEMAAQFLAYLTEFAVSKIPNLGYARHFKELVEVPVEVPSHPEQSRIIEIMRTWDRGVEAGSALIAARRRALHVARRKLVEQAEADVAQLQSFALNANRLLSVEEAGRRDLPCIELEHIEEATGRLLGTADISQLRGARRSFESGDVLYGKLRPYLRKFAHARAPGVCSTEVWVLSANPRLCVPGYLYQIVQTERFNTEANKSSGSRMPRADWEVLSQAEFPLPPLEQQRQISALLATEEEALDLLMQLVDRMRLQRAGLMERVLSGALPARRINAVSREMTEAAHA
jgi:hypothetical protein